jgi:hypothetical protein
MTIQVIHDVLPLGEGTGIVFYSLRGEIHQQFKVNRMLIEDGELMPAAFSQSVFNTPPALAAIALGLNMGYTAIYPGADSSLMPGFLAAAAPVLAGDREESLLVYADELCPAEYGALCPRENTPFAFACCITTAGRSKNELTKSCEMEFLSSPAAFLKYLWLSKETL